MDKIITTMPQNLEINDLDNLSDIHQQIVEIIEANNLSLHVALGVLELVKQEILITDALDGLEDK